MIEEVLINSLLNNLNTKDSKIFFSIAEDFNEKNCYDNFFEDIKDCGLYKGISKDGKEKISKADFDWAKKEIEKSEKENINLLTIHDPCYPKNLLHLEETPFLIYHKGDRIKNFKRSIAIVGTRTATGYGLNIAEKIGYNLAENGVTVVSGMARGCDSAGHRGAIKSDANTIAVLGTGVDKVYPRENTKLYNDIIEKGGSVISEYPLGTSPLKFNFPKRNRIISAMSKGVVVIEAGIRSGAMMTARLALEAGKEVMALPGPVTSKLSEGPNSMIKDGAYLIRNFEDILNICYPQAVVEKVKKKRSSLKGEAKKIVQLLSLTEMTMDDLASKTRIDFSHLMVVLLELEVMGIIGKTVGNSYYFKGEN